MCVVSMISDHHGDQFPKKWPEYFPNQQPAVWPSIPAANMLDSVSLQQIKNDLAAMRKEMAEIKDLLLKAKIYDEQNGEPECQKGEKTALLRKIADMLGVDLTDVLGPAA